MFLWREGLLAPRFDVDDYSISHTQSLLLIELVFFHYSKVFDKSPFLNLDGLCLNKEFCKYGATIWSIGAFDHVYSSRSHFLGTRLVCERLDSSPFWENMIRPSRTCSMSTWHLLWMSENEVHPSNRHFTGKIMEGLWQSSGFWRFLLRRMLVPQASSTITTTFPASDDVPMTPWLKKEFHAANPGPNLGKRQMAFCENWLSQVAAT